MSTLPVITDNPMELLSKHLFWDIDNSKMCWEKNKKTIIERVIERGNMDEWICIVRVYTLEEIVNTAKTFRNSQKNQQLLYLFSTPLTCGHPPCLNLLLSTPDD